MLKRYARIKQRRSVRRGPWRSKPYRAWIASFPCLICGNPNTQASHTEKGGGSMKGTDASCVPLCCTGLRHHDQLDGRVDLPSGEKGNKRMPDGRYRLEHHYRLSLQAFVRGLNARWCELKGISGVENANGSSTSAAA
jgi:hypothetical protein